MNSSTNNERVSLLQRDKEQTLTSTQLKEHTENLADPPPPVSGKAFLFVQPPLLLLMLPPLTREGFL